jgi:hypothetical protein
MPIHVSGRRRGATRAAWLALGLGLLVAACGPSPAPAAHQGRLLGQVLAGPTCPVESVTHPCPPRPVPGRTVRIQTPGGALAATATTDARGDFAVSLAPGAYVVRVAIVPGQIGLRQVSPGTVTVVADRTVSVTILLDTGIR